MEENKVKSEEKNVKNKVRTIAIILIVGVFVVLIMCYQMSINMKKEKLDESIKQGNFEQFEKYFESSINDKTDTKDFINMSNQVYESYINREDDFDIKDEQEIVNKIFEKNNDSEIKDIQDLLEKAKITREKYKEGLNKYNEDNYNEAITLLREIKEDDYNYEEAKKLLDKSIEKIEEKYKENINLSVFKDDKFGIRFYYDNSLSVISAGSNSKFALHRGELDLFSYSTYSGFFSTDKNEVIATYINNITKQGYNLVERANVMISNITPVEATKIRFSSNTGIHTTLYIVFINDKEALLFSITSNVPDYKDFDSILESLIIK